MFGAFVPCLQIPTSKLPHPLRKRDKKKRHMKIINLLNEDPKYSHQNIKGSHNSPIPHWRGYTFRTLRHEKFARNKDGSCKVIMVDPCIVGLKGKNDKSKSQRKMPLRSYNRV